MSAPDLSRPLPLADPDMATVCPSFHLDATPHKRKRRPYDLDDDFNAHDAKRRSLHSLPIRLSPSRPQAQNYSLFTSIYQQPPTPVDTSDDESPGLPTEQHWPKHGLQGHSNAPSVNGPDGDPVDVEMHSILSPIKPRIRRARSNDIIPPHRDSNLLGAIDNIARERVPTPISSHFDNRLTELPSVPRHQFPPLRTNLSPMFEQESWISRDGLPSPVEDGDMDCEMVMDQASDGMNGLRMDGGMSSDYRTAERWDHHASANSSPGRARTARLHMGFLNDCEKCVQKVPGHYSHIIWT